MFINPCPTEISTMLQFLTSSYHLDNIFDVVKIIIIVIRTSYIIENVENGKPNDLNLLVTIKNITSNQQLHIFDFDLNWYSWVSYYCDPVLESLRVRMTILRFHYSCFIIQIIKNYNPQQILWVDELSTSEIDYDTSTSNLFACLIKTRNYIVWKWNSIFLVNIINDMIFNITLTAILITI